MQTENSTRPRFRSDLVAQPVEENGQVFVDVTDPDTGTTFRFYEIEYSVACAMDGDRDVDALKDWARDELGVEPTVDELGTVISTLADLGYLEAGPAGSASVPGGAAARGGEDVELGRAGGSGVPGSASAPSAPADVELGRPGAGAPARAAVPATSAGSENETSFEGLADEDGSAVPSEVSRAGTNPFARSSKLPIQAREGQGAAQPGGQTLRERARQTDDEDGPTNIPPPASQFDEDEVSVDLSDHLPIGTDDVKEAVRQSRVMDAPAPPGGAAEDDDEGEEIETSVASPTGDLGDSKAAAREPAAAAAAESKGGAAADANKAAAAEAGMAALAAKTEAKGDGPRPGGSKDSYFPAAADPAEPPPGEAKGSPARVVILLVVLLGAAAGGIYYAVAELGVLDDVGEGAAEATVADAQAEPEPEPPPSGVLAVEEVEATAVHAEVGDRVQWIAEAGAWVEEGDELVRWPGYDRALAALERQIGEEERLQDRLDQATAQDARGRMERLEEHVESAQEDVAQAEEDLAEFQVVAPAAGVFEPAAEEGDQIEEGEIIGEIVPEPRHVAEFEVDDAARFSAGQAVTLATESAGDVVSCDVDEVGVDSITVVCPEGEPLAVGETVILEDG